MHHFSPHAISVCTERDKNNPLPSKQLSLQCTDNISTYLKWIRKQWLQPLGTRRESHQLAEGDDETVTSKQEVKYGST